MEKLGKSGIFLPMSYLKSSQSECNANAKISRSGLDNYRHIKANSEPNTPVIPRKKLARRSQSWNYETNNFPNKYRLRSAIASNEISNNSKSKDSLRTSKGTSTNFLTQTLSGFRLQKKKNIIKEDKVVKDKEHKGEESALPKSSTNLFDAVKNVREPDEIVSHCERKEETSGKKHLEQPAELSSDINILRSKNQSDGESSRNEDTEFSKSSIILNHQIAIKVTQCNEPNKETERQPVTYSEDILGIAEGDKWNVKCRSKSTNEDGECYHVLKDKSYWEGRGSGDMFHYLAKLHYQDLHFSCQKNKSEIPFSLHGLKRIGKNFVKDRFKGEVTNGNSSRWLCLEGKQHKRSKGFNGRETHSHVLSTELRNNKNHLICTKRNRSLSEPCSTRGRYSETAEKSSVARKRLAGLKDKQFSVDLLDSKYYPITYMEHRSTAGQSSSQMRWKSNGISPSRIKTTISRRELVRNSYLKSRARKVVKKVTTPKIETAKEIKFHGTEIQFCNIENIPTIKTTSTRKYYICEIYRDEKKKIRRHSMWEFATNPEINGPQSLWEVSVIWLN